ncbi:hypothetical protein [Marinobacter halodurans]|nr:hypothetical protein [Marinobacter halodurans]
MNAWIASGIQGDSPSWRGFGDSMPLPRATVVVLQKKDQKSG